MKIELRPTLGLALLAGLTSLSVARPVLAEAAADPAEAAVAPAPAGPSAAVPSEAQKAAAPAAPKRYTFFGSLRVRVEDQNFFPTPKANGAYTFAGGALRFGGMQTTSKEDALIEFEAPFLFNLPTKAIASAPQGQLGHGASYFAANGSQVADLFLKQAYVRLKNFGDPASSLKLGRFEFSDGQETTSPDANLNWIKANRIGQRLIGPFGYTLVTRSFDGAHYVFNTPKENITAMAFFPTRGAFSLDGWDTLSDIRLIYFSGTLPRARKDSASDSRLFYIYYEDGRKQDVKTDNRPLAVRTPDKNAIRIHSFGGHYARVMNLGAGKADLTLWGVGQVGTWGLLDHAAYAFSGELGYQFTKTGWQPWLRAGYYLGSGDGNPNDKHHNTFFPILPTARIYARYPFFAEANLQDIFGQIILKPIRKMVVRSDIHGLRLAETADLWYSGGGAFNNSAFGYTGRPSSGAGDLATLYDISADYQLTKSTALTLYLAYANGGRTTNIFTSRDSVFSYAEVNFKF